MHIVYKRRPLFSDTPVPDVFITEYLPLLSLPAVKLYLSALTAVSCEDQINECELGKRIGCDADGVKAALTELVSYRLAEFTEKGFQITDIKTIEAEKVYKERTASLPSEIQQGNGHDQRQKVIADINKTFFSGVMSPSWYGEIDHWFEQYRFEPQVVYALFNECMRRQKLESKSYIAKVAHNWSQQGIVTYEDLNAYFLCVDKVRIISKKIGQKLRKNITEYDEEFIRLWVGKMNYSFEVIELALRKTSKLAHPNLEYANKLLEEWFGQKLKTAESVVNYEAVKREKFLADRKGETEKGSKIRKKPSNVGNFKQRQYSGEYLEQMIEDVSTQKE